MSLGLLAALVGVAPASAEESVRVPAYRDFMEICLSTLVDENSDKPSLATAGVLCHCTYEQIGQRQTMTKSVFAGAMQACGEAAQRDPDGFVRTYLPRARDAMNSTSR
jgi:hypothetical protein